MLESELGKQMPIDETKVAYVPLFNEVISYKQLLHLQKLKSPPSR